MRALEDLFEKHFSQKANEFHSLIQAIHVVHKPSNPISKEMEFNMKDGILTVTYNVKVK